MELQEDQLFSRLAGAIQPHGASVQAGHGAHRGLAEQLIQEDLGKQESLSVSGSHIKSQSKTCGQSDLAGESRGGTSSSVNGLWQLLPTSSVRPAEEDLSCKTQKMWIPYL